MVTMASPLILLLAVAALLVSSASAATQQDACSWRADLSVNGVKHYLQYNSSVKALEVHLESRVLDELVLQFSWPEVGLSLSFNPPGWCYQMHCPACCTSKLKQL